ncbi:hypothetical protein [Microbacterium sp. CIAB417]|uniref:hypothetical protein n=1 Tax=Microbacterium sp. CIAB417 TaxID=2860287 RepID=UPI001FAD6F6B|nr:hypothetical protein [Microbacterium sp. CIAB417]
MSISARYPARFEKFRLEALGDPAYLGVDEARTRYDEGRSLNVVPDQDPPSWYLIVAPKRHRFTVTFYTPGRTPLRTAVWESEGDGLFCRRTVDLFYPDGDPGGTVPSSEVVTVTREISPDGVIEVTLSSPLGDDDVRRASDVPVERFRAGTPAFGEWDALVAAMEPSAEHRFGLDAIDESLALVEASVTRSASRGDFSRTGGEWRVPVGARDILKGLDELLDGTSGADRIPVVDRGPLKILPLMLQDVSSGGDEQRRRMATLATSVADALEQREGRGIAADLEDWGPGSVASYAAAVKAAHAVEARWWEYGQTHAVVLVTSDDGTGSRSLALQIVPVSWVSERRAEGEHSGIDAHWSWNDIAAWRDAASSADSLGAGRREGEGS